MSSWIKIRVNRLVARNSALSLKIKLVLISHAEILMSFSKSSIKTKTVVFQLKNSLITWSQPSILDSLWSKTLFYQINTPETSFFLVSTESSDQQIKTPLLQSGILLQYYIIYIESNFILAKIIKRYSEIRRKPFFDDFFFESKVSQVVKIFGLTFSNN